MGGFFVYDIKLDRKGYTEYYLGEMNLPKFIKTNWHYHSTFSRERGLS